MDYPKYKFSKNLLQLASDRRPLSNKRAEENLKEMENQGDWQGDCSDQQDQQKKAANS